MRPAKCTVYLLSLLCRRRNTVWLRLLLICLCAPTAAPCGEWKLGASIGVGLTLSDNIFLAPAGQQQTDLAVGVNPAIWANLDSARLKVHASFAPTLYAYVNNPTNDYVANNLNVFGTLEAAEKFFYIDANAQVGETYISPFATQPLNGASISNNRTQIAVLGVSPYIKSTTGSGLSYLLRDDNTWTASNSSGIANSYINNFTGTVDGPTGRPLRWGVDYNYNYTKFENQPSPFSLELARLRLTHTFDPELSATIDGGYEKNDYALNPYQGPIYGAGFDWKPTERTDIYANAEHRFFGTSFSVGFNHRTQATAFTLNASRNLQTYPQQLFIPVGNTAQVVNAIFQAKIPDPVERQQAVNNFLQQTGLPPSLGSPFVYYTNQIYVVESAAVTFAVIGARNVLTFSASWYNSTPVTASGQALPNAFTAVNEITQSTAGISFSHKLSALTSLAATGNHLVSYSNNTNLPAQSSIQSTQDTVLLSLSHNFSPKTSGTVSVRFVRFSSDVFSSYTEQAILAGVLHTF